MPKRSLGTPKQSLGMHKRITGIPKGSPGTPKLSPGTPKLSAEKLKTLITSLFLSFERRGKKSMLQPHIPHPNLQQTF